MSWTPMIDVSEHQGEINFETMRGRGVPVIILRATHGRTHDRRVRSYYRDAIAAGYQPHEIGFYSFINPKRGSAASTANATSTLIREVTGGRTGVLYMLDVENYRREYPNRGSQPIDGSRFAKYLRDHRAAFEATMPGSYVIGYTNRAYWDSEDGPRDQRLAAELEWMVPRYPYYSRGAYERAGYPPGPSLWDEYAFRAASGPFPPKGADGWEGWQFSAGFNRQGPVYGCVGSSDLDLNFIDAEVAARWFAPPITPPPPPKEDMQIRYTTTNREGQFLIPGGELLTPEMVAALADVPRVVGNGPDEDARWDQLKARWDAGQVAPPTEFPPITVPPSEVTVVQQPARISGTITPDPNG